MLELAQDERVIWHYMWSYSFSLEKTFTIYMTSS